MKKPLKPWNIRNSDFAKSGWSTGEIRGYYLMFEYLRLSPCYELARKEFQEGLSDAEQRTLPSDFDDVRRTYGMLGDVQKTLFRAWWLKRGLSVFGSPFNKPAIQLISRLPTTQDVDLRTITKPMEAYIYEERVKQGMTATLLLAIPLGGTKSDLMKQFSKLIDANLEESRAEIPRPQIELMGQRLRTQVLLKGLRLLWFRAAKPKWEYWRLGAEARLSATYSKALDPKAPRKPSDAVEAEKRDFMTKITYRNLRKFENIAENAARGRFPCDTGVEKTLFDYLQLRKIIVAKNKWEDSEQMRLLSQRK